MTLVRRMQCVGNGKFSSSIDVLSGIRQDSVLGPVLFVPFINYLPDETKSDIFMYADDTKIYRPCK